MKYCVMLNALLNNARVMSYDDNAEVLDACYDAIDCDTIQMVPLWPDRMPKGYVAVCDEDVHGKAPIINPMASWLYGTDDHGQPITRNALVWKEIEDDFDFMTEEEAQKLADFFNEKADEIFSAVVDGVIKATCPEYIHRPATE
jgi:hypothetical protein